MRKILCMLGLHRWVLTGPCATRWLECDHCLTMQNYHGFLAGLACLVHGHLWRDVPHSDLSNCQCCGKIS